ncbi:MAG: hypothetical protein QOD41_1987 [Cryptosporangiaceae bacterium]|nr:hypothetical protein [Cryptosporangiaceae bacterium]
MHRIHAAVACLILLAVAGCQGTSAGRSDARAAEPTPASYPANVVHPLGIGQIRFGDNRKTLLDRKLIKRGEQGCDTSPVYDIPRYADAADLVFNAQDQLAFIWVFTPDVKTPENVSVDSPIDAVRKAYPAAEALPANRNSFPGLLVKGERTAYLVLYEPTTRTVVKLLAGYTDILRQGHTSGLTC